MGTQEGEDNTVREEVIRFGLFLKQLREDAGVPLQQLADRVGLIPSTISRAEEGYYPPRFETVLRIADGLALREEEKAMLYHKWVAETGQMSEALQYVSREEILGKVPNKARLRVFLCHAHGDKPSARELYGWLVSVGVKPWLDEEDLLPGQHWRQEIPKVIRAVDVVLVCLSTRSVTKEGYVQKEIKFALDRADEQPEGTIFVIPVRLEECEIPDRLTHLHWVDLYGAGAHDKLLRALAARAASLDRRVPHEPSSGTQSEVVDAPVETSRNQTLGESFQRLVRDATWANARPYAGLVVGAVPKKGDILNDAGLDAFEAWVHGLQPDARADVAADSGAWFRVEAVPGDEWQAWLLPGPAMSVIYAVPQQKTEAGATLSFPGLMAHWARTLSAFPALLEQLCIEEAAVVLTLQTVVADGTAILDLTFESCPTPHKGASTRGVSPWMYQAGVVSARGLPLEVLVGGADSLLRHFSYRRLDEVLQWLKRSIADGSLETRLNLASERTSPREPGSDPVTDLAERIDAIVEQWNNEHPGQAIDTEVSDREAGKGRIQRMYRHVDRILSLRVFKDLVDLEDFANHEITSAAIVGFAGGQSGMNLVFAERVTQRLQPGWNKLDVSDNPLARSNARTGIVASPLEELAGYTRWLSGVLGTIQVQANPLSDADIEQLLQKLAG